MERYGKLSPNYRIGITCNAQQIIDTCINEIVPLFIWSARG